MRGLARVLRFLLPSLAPEPPHARVWALASQGVSPVEIARRTRLAHDAVALVLHLRPPEKAAPRSGRFFRIAAGAPRSMVPEA